MSTIVRVYIINDLIEYVSAYTISVGCFTCGLESGFRIYNVHPLTEKTRQGIYFVYCMISCTIAYIALMVVQAYNMHGLHTDYLNIRTSSYEEKHFYRTVKLGEGASAPQPPPFSLPMYGIPYSQKSWHVIKVGGLA